MLYHCLFDYPKSLELKEAYIITPKYSNHSLQAAKDDRYGIIKLPETVTFSQRNIIEVETSNDIDVDKVLVRIPYNKELDLCLVILLKTNIVKSLWANLKTDTHKTLNKQKYNKA